MVRFKISRNHADGYASVRGRQKLAVGRHSHIIRPPQGDRVGNLMQKTSSDAGQIAGRPPVYMLHEPQCKRLPLRQKLVEPLRIDLMDPFVRLVGDAVTGIGCEVRMFKNNIGQIQNSDLSNNGEQIEDVIDVIVYPVAHVIWRTNTSGQFTVFSGKKWKRTEFFFKDLIVDVN